MNSATVDFGLARGLFDLSPHPISSVYLNLILAVCNSTAGSPVRSTPPLANSITHPLELDNVMYAQKYIQRGLIDAIESRCLRIKYPRFPPEAKWRAQAVNRNVGRRMQWMSANHRDFAPQISSIDISWCFCRKLSESWLLNRQHSNQTV